MTIEIQVVSGVDEGKVEQFPNGGEINVGRGPDSDFRLRDAKISRLHCRVFCRDGSIIVADVPGGSDTLLNGTRISEARITTGDMLQIGASQLQVHLVGDEDAETVAPSHLQYPPAEVAATVTRSEPSRANLRARGEFSFCLLMVGVAFFTAISAIWIHLRRTNTASTDHQVESNRNAGVHASAIAAREILQTYCYRCHGLDGTNEGGFNSVLNSSRLISDGYVDSESPADSVLLQRIMDAEAPMPPEGEQPRPTETEISLLEGWIRAGVPRISDDSNGEFISDQDFLDVIANDLKMTVERDRPYKRYFALTHLFNSGATDDELETYRKALSKLLNSLSWQRTLTQPASMEPSGTVLRIDLRERCQLDAWHLSSTCPPSNHGTRELTISSISENEGKLLPASSQPSSRVFQLAAVSPADSPTNLTMAPVRLMEVICDEPADET